MVPEPAGTADMVRDLWLGQSKGRRWIAELLELCCSDAARGLQAAMPTSNVWLRVQVLLSEGIRLAWAAFLGMTFSSLCSAPLVTSVSKSHTQIASLGLQEENTLPNAAHKGRNLTERSQRCLLRSGLSTLILEAEGPSPSRRSVQSLQGS